MKTTISILTLCLLVLTSCSRSMSYESAQATSMSGADISGGTTTAQADRKQMYRAQMVVTVKEVENQVSQVTQMVAQSGGYVAQSSQTALTVHVPTDTLTSFLDQTATLGKVTRRDVYMTDVTASYRDTQLRLQTATKSRERFLEILANAQATSDIIEIERELQRLDLEIEGYKRALTGMDDRVQYAIVTVAFRERVRPGPLGWVFVGAYKAVKFLLVWD